RIFDISGGVTVTIAGLTLTDGLLLQVGAQSMGGAIRNTGSTLTVANAVLSNNQSRAVARPGGPAGAGAPAGAIRNLSGATLTVMHSLFIHNQSIGDNNATSGAIGNDTGSTATVTDSTFIGNQAIAGSGDGVTGFARGGALYNSNGILTVQN